MWKLPSWINRVTRSAILWALLVVPFPFQAFSQNSDRVGGLVEGEGRAETAATCTRCHSAGQFAGEKLSREDWQMVMSTMIDEYGMPVPGDVARNKMLDYLSLYFGPELEK